MNTLPPVGVGEEYPIVGGHAPQGFQQVTAGWVCEQRGSVVPQRHHWANVHLSITRSRVSNACLGELEPKMCTPDRRSTSTVVLSDLPGKMSLCHL